MILNWGIFKNENDTSIEHVYGAEDIEDVQRWVLFKPRSALALSYKLASVLLMLMNINYL